MRVAEYQHLEDWAAYNQFRDYGMADIPSVFWVPKELVGIYRDSKPLIERRTANEARYAKAEALAKSSAFQWAYISYEGGACRPLGPTTPFKFMQSVSAKRHHSTVEWDAPVANEDASRSTVATSNDPTVPLKDARLGNITFSSAPKRAMLCWLARCRMEESRFRTGNWSTSQRLNGSSQTTPSPKSLAIGRTQRPANPPEGVPCHPEAAGR
jgi:hypothetical protein